MSFLYPHVIIVQTPTKLRIISLEKSGKHKVFQTKSRKDFRPQKALSNILDSARLPLGHGILRFLVLAWLVAPNPLPIPGERKKDIVKQSKYLFESLKGLSNIPISNSPPLDIEII